MMMEGMVGDGADADGCRRVAFWRPTAESSLPRKPPWCRTYEGPMDSENMCGKALFSALVLYIKGFC